jgi:tetratricopeptide (TPR) repeat protein
LRDENNALCWFNYTNYLLRRKDFIKAEQTLKKALEIDAGNIEYQKIFSLLLINRGR